MRTAQAEQLTRDTLAIAKFLVQDNIVFYLLAILNNNNNNESISTAQNKKSSDAPAGIKSFQFLCKCLNRARRSSNVSW